VRSRIACHPRVLPLVAVLACAVVGELHAATFTVTDAADAGPGTLRQTILDANATPGADLIAFAIPGAGPHTIVLANALPSITDTVVIDGYSQPGASPNTRADGWDAQVRIEIDAIALASARGLQLLTGSAGSEVRGLAIVNVRGVSIQVEVDDAVVAGNIVGLRADARTPNTIGQVGLLGGQGAIAVYRSQFAPSARRVTIGGPAPADRNLVAGTFGGISVNANSSSDPSFTGTEDTTIENNWLGLDGSGLGIVAVRNGISLARADGTRVRRNVIANPGGSVLRIGPYDGSSAIDAGFRVTDLVLERNRIGVDPVGDGLTVGRVPFGGVTGISLSSGSVTDVRLGDPLDAASGNVVAHLLASAIALSSGVQRVTLSGNRLVDLRFGNGADQIAIDLLLPTGPNANDALDADSGSNQLQNHPVMQSAVSDAGSTSVGGVLASAASTAYRIEFFAASYCPGNSGRGHAEQPVGALDVSTDAQGDAVFVASLPRVTPGRFISAIATDPDGNSSELGPCVEVSSGARPGALRLSSVRYETVEFGPIVQAVVRRVGGSDGAVAVRLASEDASAQAGSDYLAIDTVLTWNDGDASDRLVPLALLDDLAIEPDEHFVLRLRDPSGGADLGRISGSVVNLRQFLPVRVFADGFEE
jgi:hypothetical protein